MSYKSLREFLELAERRGELKRMNGAHWDLEMSGIAELVHGEGKGKEPRPAILFDEIPDYPKGYRTLFGQLDSTWRIAKVLGLPEDQTDRMSLVRNWRKKQKEIQMIPPKVVSSGPVLSHTDTGEKVDVLKFPVPRFHELDMNRYIGTGHAVINMDPDTGYVNLGTYRNMVVDRNTLCLHCGPGRRGSIIMEKKYFERGRAMPIAIALGMDPLLFLLSCQPGVPMGVSEYDYAGGIKTEPIEVIKGPYTGLPLPAHAEILIEGECLPGEFIDEGPFGEWHGYYANQGLEKVPEHVIRVKAIHYQDNPILTCSHMAVPPHESSLAQALAYSQGIWDRLEEFGIPGIKSVWCYEVGCGMVFNVISIEQLYTGHSRQVGLIASQYTQEQGKYTIVVEDDIDPSDLQQVIWAMTSRNPLDRAIQMLPLCRTSNSNPSIPMAEKRQAGARKTLYATRVVIDTCRDLSWKPDWYPIARLSPELRANITAKWGSTLLDLTGKRG
jgi:UbiD family decarboxylase